MWKTKERINFTEEKEAEIKALSREGDNQSSAWAFVGVPMRKTRYLPAPPIYPRRNDFEPLVDDKCTYIYYMRSQPRRGNLLILHADNRKWLTIGVNNVL